VSTITKGMSVETYEDLIDRGILPETNRFELIDGRIVEKDMKGSPHTFATQCTRRAIDRLLPRGWHTREEKPVRLPNRDSEPEPDVSVVRGEIEDYAERTPGPEDVALVVEVTRSTVAKDRALIPVYDAGGIPVYWIVNIQDRQLEVYTSGEAAILTETQTVDLMIGGQLLGQISIADLLPRRQTTAS
jgi:Uma2 family endonuclease